VVKALAASGRLVVLDVPIEGPFLDGVLPLATQLVVVAGCQLRQLAALAVVGRWVQARCDQVGVCLRGTVAEPLTRMLATHFGQK